MPWRQSGTAAELVELPTGPGGSELLHERWRVGEDGRVLRAIVIPTPERAVAYDE
jgi:hypothetical protein